LQIHGAEVEASSLGTEQEIDWWIFFADSDTDVNMEGAL
jgi:hypothetical protein